MTSRPMNASGKMPLRWGGDKARIAVIPGDGIGKEVTPEAVKVIRAATARAKRPLEFVEFDWGADRYLNDGVTLPAGAVEMLRDEFDAILFGALGDPRVPSNQHAADILLGLRFKLDLYVNARPVELLHDRLTPLRDRTEKDIRLMVFRENTEGLYVGVGGFFKKGTPDEIAVQEDINSHKGVERILRHAFHYARTHTRTPEGIQRIAPPDGGTVPGRGPALLDPMPATNPTPAPPSESPSSAAFQAASSTSPKSASPEGASPSTAKPLRLCMSDKSNALTFAHDLWQRVFHSL